MSDKEVSVRENFLPVELYQQVNEYSKELLFKKPTTHNFLTHHWWQPQLVLDSFPIITHKASSDLPFYSELKDFVETFSGFNADIISFYFGTTFSYFPWHNDGKRDGAMTIYLNDIWDENWGGYYLFNETDNDIRAIPIKPNLVIMSRGPVRHSTTAVNKTADIRRTIQIFLSEK